MRRWLQKWWWLTVILAIALVIGWKEEQCQAQAYQCRAEYLSQVGRIPINEKAAKEEAIKTACESNSYFCRLFEAANLPAVLLVFVGVGGIWAALRTLRTVQQQTKVMDDTLKNLVSKEMPRLRVELENPILDIDDLPPRIQCKIECYCPTPAFFEDGEITAYLSSGIPPVPQGIPIYLPAFIKESGIQSTWAIIFENFDEQTIDQIRSGKLLLRCQGYVRWKGIHLGPDDPPYQEIFDFVWSPYETSMPGYAGQWEKKNKNDERKEWKPLNQPKNIRS